MITSNMGEFLFPFREQNDILFHMKVKPHKITWKGSVLHAGIAVTTSDYHFRTI